MARNRLRDEGWETNFCLVCSEEEGLPVLVVHAEGLGQASTERVLLDEFPISKCPVSWGQVDPDVISSEDRVSGTRYDLRTRKVRGPWCPWLPGLNRVLSTIQSLTSLDLLVPVEEAPPDES
jgi:hypothetical protein